MCSIPFQEALCSSVNNTRDTPVRSRQTGTRVHGCLDVLVDDFLKSLTDLVTSSMPGWSIQDFECLAPSIQTAFNLSARQMEMN